MRRVCPHFRRSRSRDGDDCFGLHFGERFNPKNIGPLAYAVLNSPTVGEADAQVARYIKLYNQAAQASVIIEGQRAYMRYVLTGLDIPTARQQNEYGMAVLLNTIRMMVGSQWAPSRFSSPMKTGEHFGASSGFFSAPVLFGYTDEQFSRPNVSSLTPRCPRRTRDLLQSSSAISTKSSKQCRRKTRT